MKLEEILSNSKHNTFGGIICSSDFNTSYEGRHNIAERIAADWRFDEQCRKNIESINRKKVEKKYA